MDSKLKRFDRKLDKDLLEVTGIRTIRDFSTGDYYYLNTQAADRFYKQLGLYNRLFMERLAKLDEHFALDTIRTRFQQSGMCLKAMGNEVYPEDSDGERVFNYLVDCIESHDGVYKSKHSHQVKAILELNGKFSLYVELDIVKDVLNIYILEKKDGRMFIAPDFLSSSVGDSEESDWYSVLKDSIGNPVDVDGLYTENPELTYGQLVGYCAMLNIELPQSVYDLAYEMDDVERHSTFSDVDFDEFTRDMHDADYHDILENFDRLYSVYQSAL